MWKDIEGYEGLYEVSDSGLIYSKPRLGIDGRKIGGKIMKQGATVGGYSFIILRKDGNSYNELIHRLVAIAFVSNPDNKPEVNHINGNKLNNWACNLEWCTTSENRQHAMDNGLHGGNGMKKRVKVTNTLTGESFIINSKQETAKYFNYHKSWVNNKVIKNGNPFKHKHFELEVL